MQGPASLGAGTCPLGGGCGRRWRELGVAVTAPRTVESEERDDEQWRKEEQVERKVGHVFGFRSNMVCYNLVMVRSRSIIILFGFILK